MGGGDQGTGNGGGVYLDNCATLFERVTFRNNVATPANGGGGGLWTRFGTLRLLDSVFEDNTNGGAMLNTDAALVSGNVITANTGHGLNIGTQSTTGIYSVTVSWNLLQNNTGSGLRVPQPALSLLVEDNDFIGNQGGGLYLKANSTTGMTSGGDRGWKSVQDNTTTATAAGVALWRGGRGVKPLHQQFTAGGVAGCLPGRDQQLRLRPVLCTMATCCVVIRNRWRRSVHPAPVKREPEDCLPDMACLTNTATGTGSAPFTSAAIPMIVIPSFSRTFTLGNNTGGEGAMVTIASGTARFTNTILYSGTVGSRTNWKPVTLDHVLRYDVVTPTLAVGVSIADVEPITGRSGYAADGVHLTNASAAGGCRCADGVLDDIDGTPRPLGTAPDVGADESPYSLAEGGVQVSMLASIPQWKAYYIGANVPPSTYLQQDYLIPFSYLVPSTAPRVTAYALQDTFPANLDPVAVSYPRDGLLPKKAWHSRGFRSPASPR